MTNVSPQRLCTPLFPAITDSHNLLAAWEKVEENAGGPGVDGISVEVFGLTIEEEIPRLQNALRNHTYRPQPLLRVQVNKPQGGQRALAIPTVRDRVAQTAMAFVITPILEAEFEDVSFGYRHGRSVAQALFQVRRYRDEGYQWVVDADLDAFFDTVDWRLLLARLKHSIPDPDILRLVKLWLRADIRDGARLITLTQGIPQGAPVSPVLANLYLDHFDEAMMQHGYKLVRYANDFLILCKEQPQAAKALQLTESLLGELRLSLKPEKTRITNFHQGFHYLGTLFLRTLDMVAPRRQEKKTETKEAKTERETETKGGVLAQALGEALQKAGKTARDFPVAAPILTSSPVAPQSSPPVLESHNLEPLAEQLPSTQGSEEQTVHASTSSARTETEEPLNEGEQAEPSPTPRRVQPPLLRTLYIQEQGSVLAREDERLLVKKAGALLLDVPAVKIDQIFIFGNCTITTPAMTYCLKEDIPIVLFSSHGNYYGVIDSPLGDNVSLHRQQFTRAADPVFCLTTAKAIVAAKLHNCRLLLQRHQRRKHIPLVATAIERMGEISVRLTHAATVEEVNGYEGAGAAQYFAALGQLVEMR